MHKIGSVLKVTLAVLLILILIANLYLLVMQLFSKNKLPKVFGIAQVVVVTGSMSPSIEAGDLIVICEQKEYEVDDIITFYNGRNLITHRIKSIDEQSLLTQGDANNVSDPPITIAQVEGKMLFRIPHVGRAALFLKTPFGVLLMIIAGLLLYAGTRIADQRK